MAEPFSGVILAGGLGTRLSRVVSDVPKPMAKIGSRPFLALLFDYLKLQGFGQLLLSVGYRHEIIVDYFGDSYRGISLRYLIESEPLGTGGAIRTALDKSCHFPMFVINGDSFLELDYRDMHRKHLKRSAPLSIAVKRVDDVGRYSRVLFDGALAASFDNEGTGPGFINVGTYLVSRELFDFLPASETRFSFEDVLQAQVDSITASVFITSGYFIDIGVPADYACAQEELPSRVC